MAKNKKVKSLFDSPDMDDLIISGEIKMPHRLLWAANTTELVELCRLLKPGCRAHKGLTKKELINIITVPKKECGAGPVDKYRDLIMSFLGVYWKKIKDQLDPDCNGDCYAHHDAVVLDCYLSNKERLLAFKNKKEK